MNYLDRAKKMGLNLDLLKKDKNGKSVINVNSFDELKKLFSSETKTNNIKESTNDNPTYFERVLNSLYFNTPLEKKDEELVSKYFPMEVSVYNSETITITENEDYDSDNPCIINTDNLIFDGGSITATNTVLNITANSLEVKKQSNTKYQIAIYGKDGSTGASGSEGSAYSSHAKNGQNGSPLSPGSCPGGRSAKDGSDGGNGGNGEKGDKGEGGYQIVPPKINIIDFIDTNPFIIKAIAGAGGNGGKGGKGGNGQDAGKGGNGCDSGCEGTDGSNGGKGGDGGDGGNGGNGGDGGAGGIVYLNFPKTYTEILYPIPEGGLAGAGGEKGKAGDGGSKGSGGKHCSGGSAGSSGKSGEAGKSGEPGKEGQVVTIKRYKV